MSSSILGLPNVWSPLCSYFMKWHPSSFFPCVNDNVSPTSILWGRVRPEDPTRDFRLALSPHLLPHTNPCPKGSPPCHTRLRPSVVSRMKHKDLLLSSPSLRSPVCVFVPGHVYLVTVGVETVIELFRPPETLGVKGVDTFILLLYFTPVRTLACDKRDLCSSCTFPTFNGSTDSKHLKSLFGSSVLKSSTFRRGLKRNCKKIRCWNFRFTIQRCKRGGNLELFR